MKPSLYLTHLGQCSQCSSECISCLRLLESNITIYWILHNDWHDPTQHNTHLMAIFQDKLSKPVPECLHSGWWAKDAGGGDDNWSCKTRKAPVKSSPSTNQHPALYRPDALHVAQSTMSEHWKEMIILVEEKIKSLNLNFCQLTPKVSKCHITRSYDHKNWISISGV